MRLSPATKTENQSSWENQSSYPKPFRGTAGLGNKIIKLFVFAGVLCYFLGFVCLFPFCHEGDPMPAHCWQQHSHTQNQ